MKTDSIIKLLKEQGQIILQGAPGTGKTYATVELAVALCCPNEYSKIGSDHKRLKDKYNELVKNGRVAFTTFHQSMDYEDFVEGYKPTTKNERTNGDGDFKLRDGIFKEICIKAKNEQKVYSFDLRNAFDAIKNNILNEIQNSGTTVFQLQGMQIQYDFQYVNGNYQVKSNNSKNYGKFYPGAKFKGQTITDILVKGTKNNIFDIDLSRRQSEELTVQGNYGAVWALVKEIGRRYNDLIDNIRSANLQNLDCKKEENIATDDKILVKANEEEPQTYTIKVSANGDEYIVVNNGMSVDAEAQENLSEGNVRIVKADPYLLIIDEINRANISKVMGELITLLEKGKREGNEDARNAKLPYSQKEFTVPDNLYIIGTMNTADRSLGSIDYAIRRRFAFVTLEAEENHVGNKYKDSFNKVKKLIEECRDDDFEVDEIMVGHSYFMPKDDDEWQRNIDYKIIPLLLEYFKDGVLIDRKNIFTDRKMTKKDQLKSYLSNKNQKNVPEGEIEDQQQSKQQTAPE